MKNSEMTPEQLAHKQAKQRAYQQIWYARKRAEKANGKPKRKYTRKASTIKGTFLRYHPNSSTDSTASLVINQNGIELKVTDVNVINSVLDRIITLVKGK